MVVKHIDTLTPEAVADAMRVDKAELVSASQAPKTPEQIVVERAEARWQHLIKQDFAGAYAYLTPAYRDVVRAMSTVTAALATMTPP